MGAAIPTVEVPDDGDALALTFAQDNEREFIQGIAMGLAMAAKDRGLAFSVSIANNDAARMIEQLKASDPHEPVALLWPRSIRPHWLRLCVG